MAINPVVATQVQQSQRQVQPAGPASLQTTQLLPAATALSFAERREVKALLDVLLAFLVEMGVDVELWGGLLEPDEAGGAGPGLSSKAGKFLTLALAEVRDDRGELSPPIRTLVENLASIARQWAALRAALSLGLAAQITLVGGLVDIGSGTGTLLGSSVLVEVG